MCRVPGAAGRGDDVLEVRGPPLDFTPRRPRLSSRVVKQLKPHQESAARAGPGFVLYHYHYMLCGQWGVRATPRQRPLDRATDLKMCGAVRGCALQSSPTGPAGEASPDKLPLLAFPLPKGPLFYPTRRYKAGAGEGGVSLQLARGHAYYAPPASALRWAPQLSTA